MSKHPRFTIQNVGGKTPNDNRRGPWHIIDRQGGQFPVVASRKTQRGARIFAHVLNAERLLRPCPRFMPDHNGECLLCDGWADTHTTEAIAAGERSRDQLALAFHVEQKIMACPKHPWWTGTDTPDCPACRVEVNSAAFDTAGNMLPFSPDQVQAISHAMVDKGTLVCSLWRVGNDLAIRVEGPPSLEVLRALEQAVEGYRNTLRSVPKKRN